MIGHGEEGNSGRIETRDAIEMKDKYHGRKLSKKDGTFRQFPQDATKTLDTEKIKAAFERRKASEDITSKTDPVDELERELEDVEVPDECEKIKHERKQSWSKPSNKPEPEKSHHVRDENDAGDGGRHQAMKGSSFHLDDFGTVEEGEVESFNDANKGYRSPMSSIRKRKEAGSPLDKPVGGKQQNDYESGYQKQNHHDYLEDRNGLGRLGYSERDHTRQVRNHV